MSKKYYIETGVKLTPQMAEEWLMTVKRQRSISDKTVKKYEKLILNKKWVPRNGDTMVFDWNGEFRDGQHRAWAVFNAKIPIMVDVVYNVDPESVRTIDCGNPRSASDTLVMESKNLGNKDLKHSTTIASALKIIKSYLDGNIYSKGNATNDEAWKLFQEHPEIVRSAEVTTKGKKLASVAICCALHYLFTRTAAHIQLADDFFDKFTTGEGLGAGSPILALRNRFIAVKSNSKASLERNFVISCFVKAWDAFREGRTMKTIVFNPEHLPPLTKRRKRRAA